MNIFLKILFGIGAFVLLVVGVVIIYSLAMYTQPNWWQAILMGLGIGLLVVGPIIYSGIRIYKNTTERTRIKQMIEKGQFLTPIDVRDYDSQGWSDKITPDANAVPGLNVKLFKKPADKKPEAIIRAEVVGPGTDKPIENGQGTTQ